MSPELVADPGWAAQRPAGRPHVVVHRASLRAFLDYARGIRHATIVDHRFHYAAEVGYFELHRLSCRATVVTEQESVRRLLERRVEGGSAFVLATGPSSRLVEPAAVGDDVRIVCNSIVRDPELLRALRPDIIAFADPVFHFGPSRYAASFRDDLLAAMRLTDALFLTHDRWVGPLLAAHPEIAERLVILSTDQGPWRWPDASNGVVRSTDNVLTQLMLPAAFALADSITIAGCDGRDPNERYFWSHNPQAQYADELMGAAFDAHPAFFRDRDYADYYEAHCQALEEFFTVAEGAGKRISSLTPSHIPALRKRGASSP